MSVNVINHEDIENYKQMLEKHEVDKAAYAKHDDYYVGYSDGLKKAIDLAKKLNEPKKVVIPEFIANDIEHHKKHDFTLRCALRSAFDQYAPRNVYYWFLVDDGDENVKKYISAWDNGYEVDKEPKFHVRLKGFAMDVSYLNYDINSKDFFVDTTGLGSGIKIKFTSSWLKDNWPEYEAYNNAGLLEFEEVKDE